MTRSRKGKGRRSNLSGDARRKKVIKLILRDGNRCHWCREEFRLNLPPTIEHVTPMEFGGTDREDNLVLACGPCNNQRSNPPLGRRRSAETRPQDPLAPPVWKPGERQKKLARALARQVAA